MKKCLLFFLTMFMLSMSWMTYAQQKVVSGTVVDSNNVGLPGVTVLLKGTTNGTITDFDGKYSLSNVPVDGTLVFSFVGMKTQEMPILGKSTINIVLKEEAIGIEEVVAVGYGTMKKSDLTGAVSSLSGESLTNIATNRAVEAIQGKVAGVSVVKDSGRPGNGVKVRIRGIGTINNSSPLYVIDGVPSGNMDNIDPNDIQSLEILKDASSTAIYGSRGANGVILVTTKSGSFGEKTVFSVNSYLSLDHVEQMKLTNGYQWAELFKEATENDGTPFIGDRLTLVNDAIANKTVGTNWQDEVFQTGITQNHQISATGGLKGDSGNGLKYYLSGSYNSQEGVVKYTGFERFNFLSKLEAKFSKHVTLGTELSYTKTETQGNNAQNYWGDPLSQALTASPLMNPKNDDGTWGSMWFNDQQDNAAHMVTRTKDFKEYRNSVGVKGWLQVDILEGLTFKTIYNYSNSFNHTKNYSPNYYINAVKNQLNSTLFEDRRESKSWYWNNLLTYTRQFNDLHDVTLTLGHEATFSEYDGFNITATGGVSDNPDLRYIDRATSWGAPNAVGGHSGMESYFGRLTYSYENKYIMNAIFRRDGSYKFSDKNKWGTFPSVGLAWRLSEEDFIKNLSMFTNLKVRLNWGKVGNESSADPYQYLSTVNVNNMYYAINGSTVTQGGIPTTTVNPDLKWESVVSSNIGVDIGVLQDKLSLSADYFVRKTEDMIVQVPVPAFTSNSEPFVNVGTMKNNGFEFTANYSDQIGDLSFSLTGNIAFVKNEVTDLGTKDFIQGGYVNGKINPEYITRTEVGNEVGYFVGYEYAGVYKTQAEIDEDGFPNQASLKLGDSRYVDQNDDHVLDSKDYIKLGSAIPDFTYGLSGNFRYSNWDLTINVVGSQGNEIANMLKPFISQGEAYANLSPDRLNRYPVGDQPRMTVIDPNKNFFKMSNFYVEDGSFLKIKTVQLGYTLPKRLVNRVGLTNLRFYATGQNLFTFTKYSGFDPEISEYTPGNSNTSLAAGIDLANYPLPKSVIVGVNITF